METKKEKAIHAFRFGYNCAQAVLTAYMEDLNFDKNLALCISCGFGGGMGRLQEKCGAVTGSFMVIGIYNCKKYMDNNSRKDESYAMIQQFNEKFIAIHDTTECKSLIKYDISTEEGRKLAKENKIFDTICEKCVLDSISILDELFND